MSALLTSRQKKVELRNMAKRHNTDNLLQTWLLQSAMHFEKLEHKTDRLLDAVMDKTSITTDRDVFTSQWFDYEEEYASNFSMD